MPGTAAAILLLLGSARALDVSGTVRAEDGVPLSGVRICILPDTARCVESGRGGSFHAASGVSIRGAEAWRLPTAGGIRFGLDGRRVAADRPAGGGCYVWRGSEGAPREVMRKSAAPVESLLFRKDGFLPRTYAPGAAVETGIEIELASGGDMDQDGAADGADCDPHGPERQAHAGLPGSCVGKASADLPFAAHVVGLPGFSPAPVRAEQPSKGFHSGHTEGVFDLEFDAEGTPWVAFADDSLEGKVTVMRYDGNTWVAAGPRGFTRSGPAFAGPRMLGLGLALDGGGRPRVWYSDAGNLAIYAFDGAAWSELSGPPGEAAGAAQLNRDDTLFAATFLDSSSRRDQLRIQRRSDSDWEPYDSHPDWCELVSLAAGGDGRPHASCAIDGQSQILAWDGAGWDSLAAFTAIDRDLTQYVYLSTQAGPFLYGSHFNHSTGHHWVALRGGAWTALPPVPHRSNLEATSLGTACTLAGDASAPALRCAADGAWADQPLAAPLPALLEKAALAFDPWDVPHAAFADPARGGRLTVIRLSPE